MKEINLKNQINLKNLKKVSLILEDGSAFHGFSFGFEKSVSGEVVFNTGMTGYAEALTDPSYSGQILALTYPLIGNYGVPEKKYINGIEQNFESDKIQATALIVSDYSFDFSHFSAEKSLGGWLKEQEIPGIFGIDTRALTIKLREKGSMLGKIEFGKKINFFDPNKENLVESVSVKKPQFYGNESRKTIAVIDCGAKQNIFRELIKRNVNVVRVPFDFDFDSADFSFNGVLISNGPGDPALLKKTINRVEALMERKTPILGICLGNQLLGLAAGMKTFKLKYGHRSQNQPCYDLISRKSIITSQNHGFALKDKFPDNWKKWFINLNDKSIEGIKHEKLPFMSVQFHPEASPGPVDANNLFDEFLRLVK